MKLDSISKRTLLALGVSLLIHSLLLGWLIRDEKILVVPLNADQISTRMGFSPTKSSLGSEKIPVKPKALPTKKNPVASRKETPPGKPGTQASTSGKGPQVGGASQAVDPSALERYINGVVRKIDRHKFYPRLAKQNGEEGTIRVKITLGKMGNLLGYQVLPGNPYPRLERATQQTVRAAAPFEPLPAAYPKSQITIEVPVRFRLAQNR